MALLSDSELAFLRQAGLGRLATIGADGLPHVVPVGWSYNARLATFDIGGRDFGRTQKFRNVARNGVAALVIDDVLPPWRPRCVLVRGHAEALATAEDADGGPTGPIVRLHPDHVVSWGTDERADGEGGRDR